MAGACLLAACAAGNEARGTSGSGAGGAGTGGGVTTTTATSSGSGGGGGSISFTTGAATGSTSGAGGAATFYAYAHTNTTLFKLDPAAADLGLTQIGDFDCIGGAGQDSSMTDLAVDQQGDLWGVSAHNVYHLTVQGSAVHCASTTALNTSKQVKFYGLTFAPAGVLDPSKEVLVAGNTDGELWAIDAAGNLTQHGTLGKVPKNDGNGHTYQNAGKSWELSGDIVFLANNGSPVGFATVRDCPSPPSPSGCNKTDTLVEIDVAGLKAATTQSVVLSVRGQVVQKAGCPSTTDPSGYGSMYGIAAWNADVYGFSHTGAIVKIDNNDGSACLVQETAMDLWGGAGVTTLAPIIVPPPK